MSLADSSSCFLSILASFHQFHHAAFHLAILQHHSKGNESCAVDPLHLLVFFFSRVQTNCLLDITPVPHSLIYWTSARFFFWGGGGCIRAGVHFKSNFFLISMALITDAIFPDWFDWSLPSLTIFPNSIWFDWVSLSSRWNTYYRTSARLYGLALGLMFISNQIDSSFPLFRLLTPSFWFYWSLPTIFTNLIWYYWVSSKFDWDFSSFTEVRQVLRVSLPDLTEFYWVSRGSWGAEVFPPIISSLSAHRKLPWWFTEFFFGVLCDASLHNGLIVCSFVVFLINFFFSHRSIGIWWNSSQRRNSTRLYWVF